MAAALFRVKALYEYSSPHEDDLSFDAGQVITVTDEEDDDWYGGEYLDAQGVKKEGIFPRNFVEKLEPTAPPRPARTRTKKESEPPKEPEHDVAPPPQPSAALAEPEAAPVHDEPEPEPETHSTQAEETVESPQATQPAAAANPTAAPAPAPTEQPAAAPVPAAKSTEPQESGAKPSSNSFKDRIAAFNKPAAPPIAPFKPTGLSAGGGGGGGSGFIKKPFVAPPPSRHAYVPPPQQAPVSKIYRRDEDPEIKEKEAENLGQAEKAGLLPEDNAEGAGGEDQPKPTTLKERIALLQQQQREQAQRHADTAAKKEKPKKPAKKLPEHVPAPSEDVAGDEEAEEHVAAAAPPVPPIPGRRSTEESATRTSTDEGADTSYEPPPRRKSSKGPAFDPIHDGNEADMSGAGDTTEGQDDTTEREDNEEPSPPIPRASVAAESAGSVPQATAQHIQDGQEEEREGASDEAEDEEDVDPEVKRKEELRARMAKMSGGMGFHGMFGVPLPGPGAPPKKKSSAPKPEAAPAHEDTVEPHSPLGAPPIPTMMAMPGMSGPRRSEESRRSRDEESMPVARAPPPPVPSRPVDEEDPDEDDDETTPALTPAPSASTSRPTPASPPPPAPGGRPVPPPPVPTESRPPTLPGNTQSPTDGSLSDVESPAGITEQSGDSGVSEQARSARPPPPLPPQPGQAPGLPARSPPLSPRATEAPPMPPTATTSKRSSRPPPPIPGTAPAPPPASSRPPPPPPPGPGAFSRQSTADMQTPLVNAPPRPPQAGEENESEATEYEGDYDTDIASSVPHKDALKAHARDSSLEDASFQSPTEAPAAIPPPVPKSAPRAVPPPIPAQPPPPPSRRSVEVPQAAPPPPPPSSNPASPQVAQEEYDPYNYSAPSAGYAQKTTRIDEESYQASSQDLPERPAPGLASASGTRNRPSLDAGRRSMGGARRSMDAPRPGAESSFIADDIDLAIQSGWWKQANQVPPVLQSRRDIFYECDESTTTNQGSKTIVTREIWVLFQDYSQTILTVRYDPYDPSDAELEQRHEPPPRALRQDQMEDFYEKFGRPIAEMATSKKDTVVGDGTPQGLVLELLHPFKDALKPVGTRAYGALVYSNMGNASTQQHDVIRPGDILSIRNARFQGKHGPMHAKYSAEVGKPDHVAVVAEWDGTKKKVRAWEQGRESKKVKMESFKLDDLRSGEVKIWRVMPRSWVGWNSLA